MSPPSLGDVLHDDGLRVVVEEVHGDGGGAREGGGGDGDHGGDEGQDLGVAPLLPLVGSDQVLEGVSLFPVHLDHQVDQLRLRLRLRRRTVLRLGPDPHRHQLAVGPSHRRGVVLGGGEGVQAEVRAGGGEHPGEEGGVDDVGTVGIVAAAGGHGGGGHGGGV